MSDQVLPIARADGYYLVDAGAVTFVPLEKPAPSFAELVADLPDALFFGGTQGKADVIQLFERAKKGSKT